MATPELQTPRRAHWTLDDIPWDRFDAARVDPELLAIVKAASLVEANGGTYGRYLCGIFHDDAEFQALARAWAIEEEQHGQALGRWARLADANFDFDAALERFVGTIRLPVGASESVRGSRSSELIARCLVEIGTSSFYTALAEAAAEPALKAICQHIAADELRHYKLFYTYLKRYQEKERLPLFRRIMVAVGRVREAEDDELAFAYYAANGASGPYNRKGASRAYARRALKHYRPPHVERGIAMGLKAVGLKPHGRLCRALARLACAFLDFHVRRLVAAGA
jgi:hypothetical protein